MKSYSSATVLVESESSTPSGPLTRALFRGALAFLGFIDGRKDDVLIGFDVAHTGQLIGFGNLQ